MSIHNVYFPGKNRKQYLDILSGAVLKVANGAHYENSPNSNMKILPPKKKSDIFHISDQNIDSGYSLESSR